MRVATLGSYIAVIEKEPTSCFGVFFPDLLGCTSAGKTLAEARANASEALTLHLESMASDGDDMPVARSALEIIEALKTEEGGLTGIVEIFWVFPEMAEAAE